MRFVSLTSIITTRFTRSMASMERLTKSLEETQALAAEWVTSLGALGAKSRAMVVGLQGDLGSGKTSFVQGVAQALGITDHVTSPTFILERVYKIDPLSHCLQISNCSFHHLIHIDAYRLESADELTHLSWDNLVADPGNLIMIEWPERVASALPKDMIMLHFEFIDETKRSIEL